MVESMFDKITERWNACVSTHNRAADTHTQGVIEWDESAGLLVVWLLLLSMRLKHSVSNTESGLCLTAVKDIEKVQRSRRRAHTGAKLQFKKNSRNRTFKISNQKF